MISRLVSKRHCFILKRFIRGQPISRSENETNNVSPPDPFMIGTVCRKKDISGEYVMPEEARKQNVEFWHELHKSATKMDNEESLEEIVCGTVRRDSDNQPRYHGQYAVSNEKYTFDDATYDSLLAARAKKEPDPASDQQNQPEDEALVEGQDKMQDEVEILNVDEYFPNRKSLDTNQFPAIGVFSFRHSDDWFDSPACYRPKGREMPFARDTPSFHGLNRHGEPDTTVIDGLKLAKDSPIKSFEQLDKEIEAIKQETAEKREAEPGEAQTAVLEEDASQDEASHEKDLPEDPKPMTADDYVRKMRTGEIKPELGKLKKELDAVHVNALDSQGFYSYKGYAPDLTRFRRSELLWMLKKSIIFCDSDVLAINKPHGLIVQGKSDDSHAPVLTDLRDEFADLLFKEKIISEPRKLRIVHRLDKEATGVLILAMSEEKAAFLQKSFEERNVVKMYHAITKSAPDPVQGIIDIPIEQGLVNGMERMVLRPELREEYRRIASPRQMAKRAVTEYRIISQKGNAAFLEIKPVTGVKHQIRVHMGFGMRCPILGDHKYTYLDRIAPQKLPADMLVSLNVRPAKVRNIPMHLHSKAISLPGAGVDGKTIFVRANTPAFFVNTMKRLKLRER